MGSYGYPGICDRGNRFHRHHQARGLTPLRFWARTSRTGCVQEGKPDLVTTLLITQCRQLLTAIAAETDRLRRR